MMSSIIELLEYRRAKIWFAENKERVRRSFKGMYIAVLGEKVIDHDKDKFLLIRRLWSEGLFPGPVVIEYVD